MNLQSEGLHFGSNVIDPLAADFSSTLEAWNHTQMDYPRDSCIQQLFEAQVKRSPDAIAVISEGKSLTYKQLNQQANQLAHHLCTLGVKPETLVGIYVERSPEMIVGLLAILKAGGAYVPLTPGTPRDRLSFILAETQASIILTQAGLLNDLPIHQATVVCLDADWETIAGYSSENPDCQTTSSNLMYVIYTSGSTGQPKGVMVTHGGICNQLFWRQTTFPLTPTDRILQNIPFSFDPSVWQIFWALSFGAQLVLPRPGGHQDSAYLVNLIAEQQITVIALVPSMLRVLLEEKELDQCHCLRHVFCGGEALPGELQEQFYTRFQSHAVLHNVYGPTEASIDATFWTCKPGTNHRIAPIGKPIANAQIYILDSNLQPVPVGEPGELYIGGDGLARGYLHRPELTAERFIPHPFKEQNSTGQEVEITNLTPTSQSPRLYKTGDLARYLPDGDIEFLGRVDYQVKIRGFRIELGEIEAVLNQDSSIQQSVVVAREDRPGDKRLIAYLVPAQGQTLVIRDVRSSLKEKLPDYMVPSAFVVLERLPLNSNGKVDRHALPAPELTRPAWAQPFVAPQTLVEVELCNLWAEVLGIESIGIADNFFDLGGNSLLAARLLTQIEAVFHKQLSLNTFLQAPTVQQQAHAVSEEQAVNSWKLIVPIQPSGSKPPLFCVHAKNGNVLQYYKLAHYLGNDQPFYGIQAQGIEDNQPPHQRVEDMATAYIQELRSLQPCGPYFLSGYSFGGLVAYEMARQLQAQGQEVGKLILIDTYNVRGEWFGRVSWHSHLRRQVGRVRREAVTHLRNKFTHRSSPTGESIAPKTVNVVQTGCETAGKKYRPRPYTEQAVLIRATKAADQPWLKPMQISPDLGWKPFVKGGLDIQEIDCHHFNLMLEPNVKILAQKLKQSLAAN
ncbi:MAG: amino acid adenylation domain-containing protein [Elainellaceae cyanobacterium]